MTETSTESKHLSETFSNAILQLLQMERELSKIYNRMVKVAYTDELSKCLSPVSTDQVQHIQRLNLIIQSFESKPLRTIKGAKKEPVKFKRAHFEQDISIIELALNYQHEKLARYELLHPIAVSLKMEIEADLIKQTIEDNWNTNKWLRQIIQNIIVPSLVEESMQLKQA